jgi:hypothetical protein
MPSTDDVNPAPVHRLVGTHLRLRWEKSDQPDCDWLCHYELVMPFDEYDIRSEVYNNKRELVAKLLCNVIPMGKPTKRTSKRVPCHDHDYDAPFRDGSHASWDSARLGNIPVCVMAPDGRVYMRPNVRDHRAGQDQPGESKNSTVAGSGASTCWADAQSAKDAK